MSSPFRMLFVFIIWSNIIIGSLVFVVYGLQERFPPPPPPPPPSSSRRKLLYQLVGTVGVGAYGKIVSDVVSLRRDFPILPTNNQISSTYQQTVEESLRFSLPYTRTSTSTSGSSTILRILELGIGSDCSSIIRKSYNGAIASIVTAMTDASTSSTTDN